MGPRWKTRLDLDPESESEIYTWRCHNSSSSVQSLSCAQLFVTSLNAACQASLSITNSWSLLKLKFIESVMPSNHLILCRPLLLPPLITSKTDNRSKKERKKEKDKWYYTELEGFCTAKEIINSVKDTLRNGKNICKLGKWLKPLTY